MKKRQKAKRLVALLLTVMMIFQQTNIITFAEEEVAEPTPTVTAAEPTETPEPTQPEATEPTKAPAPQEPTATVAPTENPAPQDPAENEEPAVSPAPQDPAENEEPTVSPTPQDPAETQEPTETPAAEEPTETPEETVTPTPEVTVTPVPTEIPTTPSFEYNGGGISAQVTLSEAIPADAKFVVEQKGKGSDYYNNALLQVKAWAEAYGLEVADALVVDMHFVKDGEKFDVNGSAHVTIQFSSPAMAGEGSVGVLHIANGVHDVTGSVSQNDDGSVNAVTIDTNGFSPFVVVKAKAPVNTLNENTIPTSADLAQFVNGVEITPNEVDADGNIKVIPGKEYTVKLGFAEGQSLQFDDSGIFTFTYPEEIIPTEINDTFNIIITDSKGEAEITGCTYSISGKTLTVKINTADSNYDRFKACANVNFNVAAKVRFELTGDKKDINFGNEQTITVIKDNSASVDVSKTATYNAETGKVDYIVTVTSQGTNHNVVVTDNITGSLLTYDKNLKATSSKLKTVDGTHTEKDNGFEYIISEMSPDEVVTLEYTASVDFDGLSGQITAEQSGNTVKVTSNEDGKGDEESKSVEYQISHNPISKTKTDGDYKDGDTIPWTIKVNEDCKGTLPEKITDKITTPEYLKYSDKGIKVEFKNEKGETVDSKSYKWDEVGVKTEGDSSWTYTIPDQYKDKNYSCVITYNTIASAGTSSTDVTIGNSVTDDKGNTGIGSGTVGPNERYKLSYTKKAVAVSHNEVQWEVTIDVPDAGADKFEVTDILPSTSLESTGWKPVYDTLKENTLKVDNLLDGENYELNYSDGDSQFVLRFFYNDGDKKQYGLKASENRDDLVIKFTTINNKTWLEQTDTDGAGDAQKHINNVKVNELEPVSATAVVPISTKVEKSVESESVSIDGISYPVYSYTVVMQGIDKEEITIADTFPTEYLKLYEDFTPELKAGINNWDASIVGGEIATVPNKNGLEFKLKIKKDANGSYYSRYILKYKLIVKDAKALAELSKEALKSEDGNIKLTNTASITGTDSSARVDVTYNYDPLDKTCTIPASNENNYVATFKIEINKNAVQMLEGNGTLTVTDVMSSNLRYMPESLQITPEDVSFDASLTEGEDSNVLTITGLPNDKHIVITYSARVIGVGNQHYSNSVNVTGYGSSDSVNNEVKIENSGTGGGTNPYIYIYKYAYGSLNTPLSGATFKLQKKEKGSWTDVKDKNGDVVTVTTGIDGKAKLEGHQSEKGWTLWFDTEYCLVETVPPVGYHSDSTSYEFTIKDIANGPDDYLSGDTISISNVRENFRIIKKDSETKAALSGAEFTLTASNDGVIKTATSDGNGIVSFSELQPGSYTLKETKAPSGYKLDSKEYEIVIDESLNVSCNTEGLTISEKEGVFSGELFNTPDVQQGSLAITKTVSGDTAPANTTEYEVTVTAKSSETDLSKVTATSSVADKTVALDRTTAGSVKFKLVAQETVTLNGLPVGAYTVTETKGADDKFTVTYTGVTIENNVETVNVEKNSVAQVGIANAFPDDTSISISGTKTWDDNNNQDGIRPKSITVRVMNGTAVARTATVTADEDGNWNWKVENLPKYENGKEIVYTVEEEAVDGYTTEITGNAKDGFTIINTHTPETTKVEGSKTWDDNNNQDGKRPKSITVKVMNGTTVAGTATVMPDATGKWNWKVENLPKYENGKEIVYTVEEVKVDGYTTEITGNAKDGFTIINTHTPETTKVEGSKTWNDDNNQDGKRPESITIKLYADGTFKESRTVTADDNWSWTFVGLAKYANGTEIKYTITEDSVPGYSSEVDGYDVTNKYTPGKTSKTVTKIWKDSNNQDGKRPESISVQLLADGDVEGEPVTLNEANGWTYTWNGLDEKTNGKVIVYTVKEIDTVEGYTTSYSEDTFTITNTHKPETVEVSGTKNWVNADGVEKPEVTIVLYRNNEKFDEQKLVNDAYSFKNLDKYDKNGKEYAYRVEEVMTGDLAGSFTGSQDGNNFTNTYKANPATAKIEGTKVYEHGLAADQFEFVLTQVDENGKTVKEIGTAKNKADGTFAFEEMKYDAEGTYYYQVTEKNAGKTIDGVTYDDEVITVEVKVTDNKEGSLVAAVSKKAADVKFTNTYSANGSITLTAAKNLTTTETPIQDGQFEFTLTGNDVSQKKSNVGNTVTFDVISYDESDIGKTYTYTVEEIDKKAPGYTYDKTKYTVSVEVKDNGDGTLKAVPTYTSSATNGNVAGMVFNNTYKAEGQIILTASKKLTGRTLEKDQFAFNITEVDEKGQALAEGYKETAKNDAGGTVTFPVINYTKSGTHYYQITEQNAKADGYTYDGSVYTVVVKAGDDKAGKLSAEIIEISKDGEKLTGENAAVVFSNEYKASGSLTLKAVKSMKRQETELGTFAFELKDADGKVIETVSNNEEGEISFSELTYGQEVIGKTYTYTVSEKIPTAEEQIAAEGTKYVYDKTIYTVTVEVGDNGDGTLKLTTKVDGKDYTDTAMEFVNDTTTVTVDKVDDEGNGVANAELQVAVKDSEGNVVETWISDGTSHDITGKLIAGETYILEEISAPKGYASAEPVEFTVEKSGEITIAGEAVDTVAMVDAKLHFRVNKTDLGNGEEVAGAELTVIDVETGEEIDHWVSEIGETHDFGDKLEAGKDYILRETVAPDGYKYTTDISFSVGEDGSITADINPATDEEGNTVYLVEDAPVEAEISKVDATTGEDLEGAILRITDKDGEVVEEWTTDGKGSHLIIAKLSLGETYTLEEVKAPKNYDLAEPITFTVSKDGEVDPIVMKDARIEGASVTVTKSLTMNGDPISAVDQTFYVGLYLDEACTQLVGDIKPIVFRNASSSSVTFGDLEVGRTYYVGECDADGNVIEVGAVESGDTFFANFADGNAAVVEEEDGSVTVFFENEFMTIPDGFYVGGKLEITKKVVDVNGEDTESDETFYAGIFDDEDYTIPSTKVGANLLALEMNGGSSTTVETTVNVPETGGEVIVYVTEVDENGVPVKDSKEFEYTVSQDVTVVSINEENTYAGVEIINSEIEEEEEETPTPTPTSAPKKKTGVKTGDDTPIGMYLALFAASLVLIGTTGYRRRRRNDK